MAVKETSVPDIHKAAMTAWFRSVLAGKMMSGPYLKEDWFVY